MYFLQRNTRFYSTIVHTRPWYRYSFTSLLLGALFYSWFSFFYNPLCSTNKLYQQELNQASEHHIQLKHAMAGCKKCEQLIHELKSKIRLHTKGKSAQELLQDTMTYILQYVNAKHLDLTNCKLDSECEKEWCLKRKLFFELCSGDLQSLLYFLANKSHEFLFNCSKLNIALTQQGRFALACTLDCIALRPFQCTKKSLQLLEKS